jgi:multiple sugar transport system substrate-binding protein
MDKKRMSRRNFLLLCGGTAAGGLLGACAPQVVEKTVEVEVTREVQVEETVEVEKVVEVERTVEVAPATPEPFNLVVAAHWPLETSSGWEGVYREFVRKYPTVTVEPQEIPYGEYDVKILTQIAGGVGPDAMSVGNIYNWAFVNKGVLAVLDPYLEMFDVSTDDYPDVYVAERTFGGELYSIPNDLQPDAVVFYNKALFDEAGVSVPDADYTWDDLRAMAIQLTKIDSSGDVSQYGMVHHQFYTHTLHAYAGGFVDDAETPSKCILDTDEAIAALQMELDLIYEDQSVPGPQMLSDMGTWALPFFGAGKAAMWPVNWSPVVYGLETMKDIDIGAFIMPTAPDGNRAYEIGNTAFGVWTGSEHQEAAAEFILLLNGELGWTLAMEAAKGNVFAPAHEGAFAKWLEYPEGPAKEDREVNAFGAEYGVFMPRHERWTEIRNKYIHPDIDLIIRQEQPLAETMAEIAQAVNAELGA